MRTIEQVENELQQVENKVKKIENKVLNEILGALPQKEQRILMAKVLICKHERRDSTIEEIMKKVNGELSLKNIKPVSWGFVRKYAKR